MRVAWDLQAITGPRPTGLGVSVGMLLRALQQHAPGIEVIELRPNDRDAPLIGVPDRLKWEQWHLPAELRKLDRSLDLLYSPALGAPLSSPVPVIAHVHDLIPLIFPQQFSGAAGWYWKHLLPQTWRHCAAVTVSNESVAQDIVRLLQYPPERIHVVPYYPEPEFAELANGFVARPNVPSSRAGFICIGTHEPRKNFELAIEALGMAAGHAGGGELQLSIMGMSTPYTSHLQRLASSLPAQAQVVLSTDYTPRAQLVSELLDATALLFVSRYEGFGMPPLEAMSIGCPVVLSDIPAHRAVYADAARWALCPMDSREMPPFVRADDVRSLADVMQRLVQDHAWRQALSRSGRAYAATFSPEATATALVKAFESVASAGR